MNSEAEEEAEAEPWEQNNLIHRFGYAANLFP